ncbi:hypothetical protein LHYA1_G000188 [Lachnellula hyalina]|uniref:GmrSD restriction endonucleases N-terminal domain-containing protein n=1 Tax=Lachnellula hyalina TaxID=1316788 RepID=A0A8H8R9R2_9HELO|nr:uncharacterized protein LHYA1_G000188 [Lachnellula hyalina]TVY31011.1 hypothetical protein LHYA1_G000188 [Lachnellula hyalina]
MTSEIATNMVPTKREPIQIKDDPDPGLATASRSTATALVKVKNEESDNDKVDTTLPDAGPGDMFQDVDAPEVVDLTYEGIAEINGVDHFVCEDCIDSGHIVLDPDYQREVVWDEGRASLLITSILMGYFIPPIIFNVKNRIVNRNGQKEVVYTRICVDGKQRLTSVHKFMKGQIGFFDSNSPQKKWYFCHPVVNGHETFSNHNILPRAVKEFFVKQAFCCYEYDELTLETEETMFQLVQRGIALTPAEKMRAMSTEWATFTKQYEDDYTLIVNLSKQNRASGFRLILTVFTMIQEVMSGKRKRSSAPTLQASPQALLKMLDDKAPIEDVLKLKFKAIFDRYENLVKLSSTQITATRFKVNNNSVFDPAPDFLRAPGVEHVRTFSPLELIGTAILVSYHMDTRTDQELLEDVKAMRVYLRLNHKDLRVNAQCWVTVWEFVTEEMSRRQVITNGHAIGRPPLPNGQPVNGVSARDSQYASPYSTHVTILPMTGRPVVVTGAEVASVPSSAADTSASGLTNGNAPVGEVSPRASSPALPNGDTAAQDNDNQQIAAVGGEEASANGAQTKRDAIVNHKRRKSSNPDTKAKGERNTVSISKTSNNRPRSAIHGIKDEAKTKSTTITPPKRSTRASRPNNSPNGTKAVEETKRSHTPLSKRANSLKTASLPSKRLKQGV